MTECGKIERKMTYLMWRRETVECDIPVVYLLSCLPAVLPCFPWRACDVCVLQLPPFPAKHTELPVAFSASSGCTARAVCVCCYVCVTVADDDRMGEL